MDAYLGECEQRFTVEYLKRMTISTGQAWQSVMKSTNAQYFSRGKNTVLERLQFGGNREFWDSFADNETIRRYFSECYRYAIDKIGFLHTHENIPCAATVTEQVRRIPSASMITGPSFISFFSILRSSVRKKRSCGYRKTVLSPY